MYLGLLSRSSLFASLLVLDQEIAEELRGAGCRHCGGPLHAAHYVRRPRGLDFNPEPEWLVRLSFCCGREGCRRRATPVSVRFFGRKVYAALAFLLLCGQSTGPLTNRMLGQIEFTVGVSEVTLRRWRRWWRDRFVRGRFWQQMRARFMPPVAEDERVAADLLGRFGAVHDEDGVVRCLRFLAPAATEQCR